MLTDEEYDLMRWEDDGGPICRATEAIESTKSASGSDDANISAGPHPTHQAIVDVATTAHLATVGRLP